MAGPLFSRSYDRRELARRALIMAIVVGVVVLPGVVAVAMILTGNAGD